jgi:hypothetical protein
VAMTTLPTLAEVQAEHARRSFYYYVRKAWHVADPANPYIDNWHIGLICEYLQALYDLQIQNLIINIGPGYAKSLISSVLFPTWVWTNTPAESFLCGSYDEDLAVRDGVRSRRLILSDWYQARFGNMYALSGDQNVKSRYENTKSGQRISVGINGGIVGHRANFLVWDDPLKSQNADSDVIRSNVNEVMDGMMGTRGANPKMLRRLIIMQRLHDDDPVGHVLKKSEEDPNAPQYEHLVLPVRYEPNRFFSSIGKRDPRTQPGELLFPQLFDEKSVLQQASQLGERGTAAQQQQRPAPKSGFIFLREWFENNRNRYDPTDRSYYNKSVGRWLSWDTALKDDEQNDYTALTVWELLPDYRLLLRYAWWRKLQFPQLAKAIADEAKRWMYDGKLRGIIIEDKASGISALQTLRQGEQEIADLLIAFQPGTVSKTGRARQASLWFERDCILLPEPADEVPWLIEYEDILYEFPTKVIKDPVDSTSQAILHLENLLAEGWQARTGHKK